MELLLLLSLMASLILPINLFLLWVNQRAADLEDPIFQNSDDPRASSHRRDPILQSAVYDLRGPEGGSASSGSATDA